MKRYLSFLLLCLFIGTSYAKEQTYKVVKYCWGVRTNDPIQTAGKPKKANFTIVVDEEKNQIAINNPKDKQVYTIVSDTPVNFEVHNINVDYKQYLIKDEKGLEGSVYLRMKDGKVLEILVKHQQSHTYTIDPE